MRAKPVRLISLFSAAIFLCGISRAQDAASAKAFLNSIYHHYQSGYQSSSPGIDFDDADANRYFHSSLLSLERADVKANAGQVPAIDWDPICGCQDWDGIWDLKIDVEAKSPEKALAIVSFSLGDPKYKQKDNVRNLVITLVVEHGAWRIDDILDQSDPQNTFSIRKLLQDDLASLRKNPIQASH